MIGEQKYFLEFKKRAVNSGVVIAEQLASGGYPVFLLKVGAKVQQVETCLCFDDIETAKQKLAEKLPIADKMEQINKQAKKELDELREQLIGKAPFKDLMEVISK